MRGGKIIKAFRWKYCTIMDQKWVKRRWLAAVTQEGLPLQKICAHRLEILPKKIKIVKFEKGAIDNSTRSIALYPKLVGDLNLPPSD